MNSLFCVLQQIASHGLFDLAIEAEGDTWIDDHHTNEDLGMYVGFSCLQCNIPTHQKQPSVKDCNSCNYGYSACRYAQLVNYLLHLGIDA